MGNVSIVERAILVFYAVLMAFTFSRAVSRINEGQTLVAEEVNAIETADSRAQLLAEEVQPALRELFRQDVTLAWRSIANFQRRS